MTKRLSSQDRKLQIVQAALGLLAEVSVDRLTTRLVAAEVGVTQPALFKHFPSRESILEAVIEHVRLCLEQSVKQVFQAEGDTKQKVLGLLQGLFRFAEANPGAPRLLFFDAATSGDGGRPSLHLPLRLLIARQTVLIAELIRDETRAGGLPDSVDVTRAGELFVAQLQGQLLRWHLEDRTTDLVASAPGLVDFWWSGLEAGLPRLEDVALAPRSESSRDLLCQFDARPLLSTGVDPFQEIQAQLTRLPTGGCLVLLAPFHPTPLIHLMQGRGFGVWTDEAEAGLHTILITSPPQGDAERVTVLDLRDLPAPEPMEEVLLAVEKLAPGEHFFARLPRFPRMLVAALEGRGCTWSSVLQPSGSAVLLVERPPS